MSSLWKWIDDRKLRKEGKVRLFLLLNSLFFSILGFFVWLIVSRYTLCTLDWALCFVGYSGFFIGYVGGYIFLCRK